jgi:hypothetical protein
VSISLWLIISKGLKEFFEGKSIFTFGSEFTINLILTYSANLNWNVSKTMEVSVWAFALITIKKTKNNFKSLSTVFEIVK